MTGSNRRPSPCKGDALPAELITPLSNVRAFYINRFPCQTPDIENRGYFPFTTNRLFYKQKTRLYGGKRAVLLA